MLVFLAVHFSALFSPSLLDDADSTHAIAAQHIALSGDWVTLKVNGIRYLEKPPLPYWMVAVDYHVFGFNVFATHLPLALGVLALAALAWVWGRRAFGDLAAFYAALGVLTSVGVFLFTRILIPEVLLTFLTALALYCFLTGLEDRKPGRIYAAWAALALGMLAKGLVAPVFFLAAVVPYVFLTGDWRRWRDCRWFSGFLLFFAIAAPWHVLAALRNPDHGHPIGNIPTPGHVHGFLYFYFINEQFLRFLGERFPHDYNKLPGILYWSLHLVWLFPWSLYLPLLFKRIWRLRDQGPQVFSARSRFSLQGQGGFRRKTILLLSIYAAFILVFFSISTNQEYYTFPAYFPILLLIAWTLADTESANGKQSKWLGGAHAALAVTGAAAAAALAYGLWSSRNLPFTRDIGSLLVERDVAGYTLSMAHFLDLTGASFAALRLPAMLAASALLFGPAAAWALRSKSRHFEATASIAFTSAVFLIAAHIALVRFEPILSSRAMADTINRIAGLPGQHSAASGPDTVLLYGDANYGSSIPFYTRRQVLLVNGDVTSMLWGLCYPDAPHILIGDRELLGMWGSGSRKFLFVPPQEHAKVESLLGKRAYLLQEFGGKTLYTDRPLSPP